MKLNISVRESHLHVFWISIPFTYITVYGLVSINGDIERSKYSAVVFQNLVSSSFFPDIATGATLTSIIPDS